MRTRFCSVVIVFLVGAMAALPGYCSVPNPDAKIRPGMTFDGMKSPLVSSYENIGVTLDNRGLLSLIHDRDLREVEGTTLQERSAAEPACVNLAHDDHDEGDDEEREGDEGGEGGWDRTWDAPKLG